MDSPTDPKGTLPDGLLATAYHEAGHAIAYVRLSLPLSLRLVSIVREDNSLGRVTPGFNPKWPWSSDERRNIIIMCLSGRLAEQKGTRSNAHFETDYIEALQHALAGTNQDKEQAAQFVNECQEPAKQLVLSNWHDVERIAEELTERHELNGEEVRILLQP